MGNESKGAPLTFAFVFFIKIAGNISIKWSKDLTGFERAALFTQGA